MHCLMKHFPFIFVHLLQEKDESKKSVVHKIWPVIEYMLKIDQIISSTSITEKDLINLENFTDELLSIIKNKFQKEFIPKLHHMTHYANTIRSMGPIINLQMMRGDAKHQPFTQYAKRCRNYINICKTLSEKHQEVLVAKWSQNDTYCDSVATSKRLIRVVERNGQFINVVEKYSNLFQDYFKENINGVVLTNFLNFNSFTFRKGVFIIFSDEMYRIEAVLKCNNSFVLICTKFNTVKFYKFANCFETNITPETLFIEFDMLVCKRTYEAKFISDNQIQIFADNLDMLPVYQKSIL